MSNIWERFDGIANKDEVESAKAQLAPLQEGTYAVRLDEIKPSESSTGLPMLKGKFTRMEDGRFIYYNQNLQNINYPDMTAKNIAEAVKFLGELTGQVVEYTSMADLADFISAIPTGSEHIIEVFYEKKDTVKKFPKVKMVVPEDFFDGGQDSFDGLFDSAEEDLPM